MVFLTAKEKSVSQFLSIPIDPSHQFLFLSAIIFLFCFIIFIFQPAIKLYIGDNDFMVKEVVTQNNKHDQNAKQKRVILSLIIPAYNEEERIPEMLDSTFECIQNKMEEIKYLCNTAIADGSGTRDDKIHQDDCDKIELIVVNDGSNDNTVAVVQKYFNKFYENQKINSFITLRLLSLTKNGGKGAAVRAGMIRSNGKLCLMVDADGATEIGSGIQQALKQMRNLKDNTEQNSKNDWANEAIVFGSRAHLEEGSKASRSPVRTILMHAFHFFVETICSSKIRDTQCGFKLFTRNAAIYLFKNLHLRRWAFDIELVIIAENLKIPLTEVAVDWHEVDGSKLATSKFNLIWNSITMLRDMICVRLCYALNIWKIDQ